MRKREFKYILDFHQNNIRFGSMQTRGSNHHVPNPWWSLFIFIKGLGSYGLEVGELTLKGLMICCRSTLYLLGNACYGKFHSKPSSDAEKIVFPHIYLSRLWIDFYFPTPTSIGFDRISFLVCCVLGWTYCVNIWKCVCVLWHVRGHGNGDGQHEIWSRYQSSGNFRCDWSPMSTGFIILIKICMKIGSWTKNGYRDLVMREEGVRHFTTSVRRQLPPSMCSGVCLINQVKMLDYY